MTLTKQDVRDIKMKNNAPINDLHKETAVS